VEERVTRMPFQRVRVANMPHGADPLTFRARDGPEGLERRHVLILERERHDMTPWGGAAGDPTERLVADESRGFPEIDRMLEPDLDRLDPEVAAVADVGHPAPPRAIRNDGRDQDAERIRGAPDLLPHAPRRLDVRGEHLVPELAAPTRPRDENLDIGD